MIIDRLNHLRAFLLEQGVDAVIISKLENLHYFSGFTGDDSYLLVPAKGDSAYIITDFRYIEQAALQCPLYQVVKQEKGLIKCTGELAVSLGLKSIAFEGGSLSFDDHAKLSKAMPGIALEKSVSLDALRQIKEAEEIELIKKAVAISDAAFEDIIKFIKPGISENQVAARMENTMRQLGSERPAFTTIVASGKRGSLPHGTATEKLILSGEFVTMDYGAVYRGYHSDITRTVCVGQADARQREIYDTVLQAQLLGLSLVQPGASGKEVDKAVRDLFAEKGYGQYFGHGLGHSLGLEIHEEPRLSPSSKCDALPVNVLVTVEPGIYLPDWGGVRIEDTVLVTSAGGQALTSSPKQLFELKN